MFIHVDASSEYCPEATIDACSFDFLPYFQSSCSATVKIESERRQSSFDYLEHLAPAFKFFVNSLLLQSLDLSSEMWISDVTTTTTPCSDGCLMFE